MNIRKSLFSLLICLVFFSLAGVVTLADTIRLKDGSVLKGKVVSYNQRKFTIIVYIGGSSSQHVISVDEIESVEFDSSETGASTRSTESSGSLIPVNQGATRKESSLQPSTSDSSPQKRVPLPPEPIPPATEPATEPTIVTGTVTAEKSVSIAAAADWTSTEVRLQRGQRVVISASGEVDLGESRRTGPDGLSAPDNRKLMPNRPTGALIAVVGDDNDDFIYVGASGEFIAPHSGILFLSVNEGNLKDNNGAYTARVRVMSTR